MFSSKKRRGAGGRGYASTQTFFSSGQGPGTLASVLYIIVHVCTCPPKALKREEKNKDLMHEMKVPRETKKNSTFGEERVGARVKIRRKM